MPYVIQSRTGKKRGSDSGMEEDDEELDDLDEPPFPGGSEKKKSSKKGGGGGGSSNRDPNKKKPQFKKDNANYGDLTYDREYDRAERRAERAERHNRRAGVPGTKQRRGYGLSELDVSGGFMHYDDEVLGEEESKAAAAAVKPRKRQRMTQYDEDPFYFDGQSVKLQTPRQMAAEASRVKKRNEWERMRTEAAAANQRPPRDRAAERERAEERAALAAVQAIEEEEEMRQSSEAAAAVVKPPVRSHKKKKVESCTTPRERKEPTATPRDRSGGGAMIDGKCEEFDEEPPPWPADDSDAPVSNDVVELAAQPRCVKQLEMPSVTESKEENLGWVFKMPPQNYITHEVADARRHESYDVEDDDALWLDALSDDDRFYPEDAQKAYDLIEQVFTAFEYHWASLHNMLGDSIFVRVKSLKLPTEKDINEAFCHEVVQSVGGKLTERQVRIIHQHWCHKRETRRMPLIRELQDVLRPSRKKFRIGSTLTADIVMSPHGTASGLGEKDAELTRLCDQCGRWDHLSYVRKLGGLSICRWCQPVDPSGASEEKVRRRGTSASGDRLVVSEEPFFGCPEDYIGCCVERHFPGYGLYQGTVTDYTEETDLFKVT